MPYAMQVQVVYINHPRLLPCDTQMIVVYIGYPRLLRILFHLACILNVSNQAEHEALRPRHAQDMETIKAAVQRL